MKLSRAFFLALLVTVFVITACGGRDSASFTINVIFTEFSFTPTEFVVPAGRQITITGTNEGAVEHEFAIMKASQTIVGNFVNEEDIYWEFEVAPNDSIVETFRSPDEPGEYQVVCDEAGHYTAGMVGKLIVVADE